MPDADSLSKVTEFGEDGSTASIYDEWAATYDHDLAVEYGYDAPSTGADALLEMCPDRSIAVMDFGCGTGLVGQELAARGFSTVDGLDISDGMLDVARTKGVYRTLQRGDLTQPIPIETASYAAIICIGSMGNGHITPTHLPELIRTVLSNGPIVLYMNAKPFVEHDYTGQFTQLETDGHWTIERIETTNYMSALERPGRLVVARRASV